jgi:hypothetical protein
VKELVRSNDPVFLSWLKATLEDAGIACVIFDQFTSAAEGSIGAVPRRVMVHEDDFGRAQHIMRSENPQSPA